MTLSPFSLLLRVRKPVIILYVYHQLMSLENHNYTMRFQRLLYATDKQNPITKPTECLDLLLRHTPAQSYLTHLKIMINQLVAADLESGQLIRSLQHAKGLVLLEVELLVYVPDIMGFVRQLGHIRTITLHVFTLLVWKEEEFEKEWRSETRIGERLISKARWSDS